MKKNIKTWIKEYLKLTNIRYLNKKFLKSILSNSKNSLNNRNFTKILFIKKKKFQTSKLKKFCLITGKYKKINNNFNLNTRIVLKEFNLGNNQNFIKK